MKINEALKKERLKRKLLQKDMIKNLEISKSHYSLIEKGKHRIYADDLMKMLANNKIDYHAFFNEIANDYGYSNDIEEITRKLDIAFYESDIDEVKKVKKAIFNIDNVPIELKYHVALIEAELNNTSLSPSLYKKFAKEIFDTDNWTENRDALRLLGNSMRYLDKDTKDVLISSVLKRYKEINDFDKTEQIRVASICLNYLFNCDQQEQNINIKNIFSLIDSLNPLPDFSLYKLVAAYFKAKFSSNIQDMKIIKQALDLSGYEITSDRLS